MVSAKNRIIFLDLMRAFAVLMMVQGHTVHTFLASELRSTEYIAYAIWHTMRGFTAPIFMFTAGTVFTYLLLHKNLPFSNNLRVKKGLKRFSILLVIAYILRYPTYKIFDFSDVTQANWLIFFSVDALHLIAVGLLSIIAVFYISSKFKLNIQILFAAATAFFFLVSPSLAKLDWGNFLPLPIAAYFYKGTGSLFPLFPWLGYIFAGAILGNVLAKNREIYLTKRFSFTLIILGGSLAALGITANYFAGSVAEGFASLVMDTSICVHRVGVVLALNGIVSYLSLRLTQIPNLITQVGRNTLLIYVVHLIILYGCAWFPGFYRYFSSTYDLWSTLGAVVLMYIAMIGMVIIIERAKTIKFRKLAADRV